MKIAILGAGTWVTPLARMLANAGHEVTMWSALPEEIRQMQSTHAHRNLPGMVIPEQIHLTEDIGEAIHGQEIVVFAVPSVFVRGTVFQAADYLEQGQILVDVAKGIEPETLKTMSEIIEDVLSANDASVFPVVALSGPTHAEEVAQDMLTTIVAASKDAEAAKTVQVAFSNDTMRVYTNSDVKGVELCGALKNVVALAAGISRGLGYGDNARAALITRGMSEITTLGLKMGCLEQTFSGLAGFGDLMVTAFSEHSRNNRAGYLIGSGKSPAEAVKEVGMVVEGMNALPAAMELSRKYGVEMPIVEEVDQIVNHGISAKDAVATLMGRALKSEIKTNRA